MDLSNVRFSEFMSALMFIIGLVVSGAATFWLISVVRHRMLNAVPLDMTYIDFLVASKKWHDDHDTGPARLIFEDEARDRYCPRCGKALVVTLMFTGRYHSMTGKRQIRAYIDCPSFGIWPITLHTKKQRSGIGTQDFMYDLIYQHELEEAAAEAAT